MFFKKKKVSFDAQQPNQIKNALNIICPNCNHEQLEPKMALSTNCKKCNTYFKIVKGKAVPPAKTSYFSNTETKKVATPSPTPPEDPRKKETLAAPAAQPVALKKETSLPAETPKPVAKPVAIEQKQSPQKNDVAPASAPAPSPVEKTEEPIPEQAPKRYVPAQAQTPEKEPAAGLFGKGKSKSTIKSRDVSCFECDRIHQAPMGATSTNCPQCGTYITLKDFEIRGPSNQRIQTRGNVIIHKKASVTGITIQCHDLTVTGQFTGGVNCSGDFILNSHGKLMGEVKCKRLIIEKKADIEFASHVYADEIIIDGSAIGNFTCSGKLQLKKKATLTGDISVKTMTMEEGAKHNGSMSIGQ